MGYLIFIFFLCKKTQVRAAYSPGSECVFVQVSVMPVISQGFDYRPEEVLCSQAASKADQASQPLS